VRSLLTRYTSPHAHLRTAQGLAQQNLGLRFPQLRGERLEVWPVIDPGQEGLQIDRRARLEVSPNLDGLSGSQPEQDLEPGERPGNLRFRRTPFGPGARRGDAGAVELQGSRFAG